MKPVKFDQVNIVFAEDQEEYMPLPACRLKGAKCPVITAWKLTIWERIKLLFTGRLWLAMLTFNKPLQPVILTTKKSDVLTNKRG